MMCTVSFSWVYCLASCSHSPCGDMWKLDAHRDTRWAWLYTSSPAFCMRNFFPFPSPSSPNTIAIAISAKNVYHHHHHHHLSVGYVLKSLSIMVWCSFAIDIIRKSSHPHSHVIEHQDIIEVECPSPYSHTTITRCCCAYLPSIRFSISPLSYIGWAIALSAYIGFEKVVLR